MKRLVVNVDYCFDIHGYPTVCPTLEQAKDIFKDNYNLSLISLIEDGPGGSNPNVTLLGPISAVKKLKEAYTDFDKNNAVSWKTFNELYVIHEITVFKEVTDIEFIKNTLPEFLYKRDKIYFYVFEEYYKDNCKIYQRYLFDVIKEYKEDKHERDSCRIYIEAFEKFMLMHYNNLPIFMEFLEYYYGSGECGSDKLKDDLDNFAEDLLQII